MIRHYLANVNTFLRRTADSRRVVMVAPGGGQAHSAPLMFIQDERMLFPWAVFPMAIQSPDVWLGVQKGRE